MKTAPQFAVNRGHIRIEEKDLLAAEEQYSRFALDSLLVESGTRVPRLDALIYEFVGGPEILIAKDVLRVMKTVGIPDERLDDVLDTLCEITFLGLEVGPGRFAYMYDEDSATKLEVLARKTATDHFSGVHRYRINRVFHAYLEIQPDRTPLAGTTKTQMTGLVGNA